MRTPPHPTREQITLPGVLEALSDPTRLAIALMLAERRDAETVCGDFLGFGSKTNLSYHLAKMREAGVTRVRAEGTRRYISIRWDDLDARFPGLIDWLLNSAKREGLNVMSAGSAKRGPRRPARTRGQAARRKPAA
jgi:DNA-binding transcriptional ArsR family regulator